MTPATHSRLMDLLALGLIIVALYGLARVGLWIAALVAAAMAC
jgi:hypothetical protein